MLAARATRWHCGGCPPVAAQCTGTFRATGARTRGLHLASGKVLHCSCCCSSPPPTCLPPAHTHHGPLHTGVTFHNPTLLKRPPFFLRERYGPDARAGRGGVTGGCLHAHRWFAPPVAGCFLPKFPAEVGALSGRRGSLTGCPWCPLPVSPLRHCMPRRTSRDLVLATT